MTAVRVLRLLEYTFDSQEAAEKHMANFQVPLNGTKNVGDLRIRSSAILDMDPKPVLGYNPPHDVKPIRDT